MHEIELEYIREW